MQQTARVHNINLSFKSSERGVWIEEAAGYEGGGAEFGAVDEEVVAEVEEGLLEVEAVKRSGWGAIEGEFAEFLAETAAGIEKGLILRG